MSEAAEILYDLVNNITMMERRVPILVACNKQDLQFAKRATQIEQELEKDMEELRRVRRATQDDQDTAKEHVAQQGYLEQQRTRFSFSDAKLMSQLPKITFCECSVIKEEIADIWKFIQHNM